MGKSKSCFDLNHDWITGDDLIRVKKDLIWKHVIWFGFDFILRDLIWYLNKSQLSVIWAKE